MKRAGWSEILKAEGALCRSRVGSSLIDFKKEKTSVKREKESNMQ